MKSIQTQSRIKPFCHEAGKSFLLPASNLLFTCYPTKLKVSLVLANIEKVFEINCLLEGPFQQYTWELRPRQQEVHLHFKQQQGFFYFIIKPSAKGFSLFLKRAPEGGLKLEIDKEGLSLKKGECKELAVKGAVRHQPISQPQLFLGSKKKQEMQSQKKRQSIDELMPLFFEYASLYPPCSLEGFPAYDHLNNASNNEIGEAFLKLLTTHFDDYLKPCLHDPYFHHLFSPPSPQTGFSLMQLLKSLYPALLALFVDIKEDKLSLLPRLPYQLHTGKLIGLQPHPSFSLSLYWSKKKLRQVELYAHEAISLQLLPHKKLCQFRCYTRSKKNAKSVNSSQQLFFEAKTRTYFDRFQSAN